jgi:hypothetical protein
VSLDLKHDQLKNHETQSPTNRKMKPGKTSITKKNIIKKMRVKMKIKNKLEGIKNFK